jgi:hypothetical protein
VRVVGNEEFKVDDVKDRVALIEIIVEELIQ